VTSVQQQISSSIKKSSDVKLAGILLTFAGIVFLLLTTTAEAIYPHFSLQTNAISDLAAIGTPTTVIEEAAILILAISWMVGAYYLFRDTGRKALMVLNMLPGAGFLLAGLSPENVNLVIHSAGTFAFPLGAIVAILSYRTIDSSFKYFSVALGALSLVATFLLFAGWRVVCGTCGYSTGIAKLALGLGGWESMIIYPLLVWLIGFGNYLLAFNDAKSRGSQ
jgi:hypothetical membrane protein